MTTSTCESKRWGLSFAEIVLRKRMVDEDLEGSGLVESCFVSVHRTIPHIARRFGKDKPIFIFLSKLSLLLCWYVGVIDAA